MRKNFVIVDDIPGLGQNVHQFISDYYNSKKDYDYDLKLFIEETHFKDAKSFIEREHNEIDVIFSDQNLRGGKGIELFNAAKIRKTSIFEGVLTESHIFKVLHSNDYARFSQHQADHFVEYDYFINSDIKEDLVRFLDYYESIIVKYKKEGNPVYSNFLYQNPEIQKAINKTLIRIDDVSVFLRDVLFLIMDKNDQKKEYYYFAYVSDDCVKVSKTSKKPESEINSIIESLSFYTGTLNSLHREKFKINPLWVTLIDHSTSRIKIFPAVNLKYEIEFEKLSTQANFYYSQIDKFFV